MSNPERLYCVDIVDTSGFVRKTVSTSGPFNQTKALRVQTALKLKDTSERFDIKLYEYIPVKGVNE